MGDILAEIAAYTKERIAAEKAKEPQTAVRRRAEEAARMRRAKAKGSRKPHMDADSAEPVQHAFFAALAKTGMSYICEVKKASPSKGLIAPDFPYLEIAKEYEAAGASAISCLTEPRWFLGSDYYMEKIAQSVSIPVLRKDFTIDEYMVCQASALGASAVLLICAILDDVQLKSFRELAEELGMDALVEAHDEAEVERAAKAGARIIGVNNRNLRDFSIDMENSIRLRRMVSDVSTVFVSESGITNHDDIRRLEENGISAVLIFSVNQAFLIWAAFGSGILR